MRVYKWALRICEKENGDMAVVAYAAIFHDTGKAIRDRDKPHSHISAGICAEYLTEKGFEDVFLSLIHI